MISSNHPNSVDEWLQLYRQKRNAALALRDASQPNEAWLNAGFSIEACLKAAIMRKEGLNRWPGPHEDPRLWTHDLTYLANRLGVGISTIRPNDPAAPAWKMGLEWQRGHGYSVDKLPMRFATQMCDAAFGANGVVQWLATRYRLSI